MITQLDRSIYLASRSPRRRELLAQIGVRFQVLMFRDRPEADAELDELPDSPGREALRASITYVVDHRR